MRKERYKMIKQYVDRISGKTVEYIDGMTFYVHLRRSNCRKRLVSITKDIDKAFASFNSVKVYAKDYKYLEAKVNGSSHTLVRSPGEGVKPHSLRGLAKSNPYKKKPLPKSLYVPTTLYDRLLRLTALTSPSLGISLKKSQIVRFAIAYLASLETHEAAVVIDKGIAEYKMHKHLSREDNEMTYEDFDNEFF